MTDTIDYIRPTGTCNIEISAGEPDAGDVITDTLTTEVIHAL